jgi:glucosylceramidase
MKIYSTLFYFTLVLLTSCTKSTMPPTVIIEDPVSTPKGSEIAIWSTSGDRSQLIQKVVHHFNNGTAQYETIEVDSNTTYQSVDGFGFTLTGGSAKLISKMDESKQQALLKELFGKGEGEIGVNYLRVSVGASDLDELVFSYNDLPLGQQDLTLSKFNLSYDTLYLLPVLKKILSLNPDIKIMGSPWSPPTWMKDNGSSIGGTLKTEYYNAYAIYLAKYITTMKSKGVKIDALTIQNEPQHGGNNPSMVMSDVQQATFVKNHLGPLFKKENINTKIVVWDHNCDRPSYPINILNDAAAKAYVDGSAFHLYNGDISALSAVKNAHPDRNLYFTEQWTGANGSFDGDLNWHIRNVVIGSMRNWSKTALEWNLANDPTYGPHTIGGCTECKGALTIDGQSVTRNVAYYIIGQASKFVPAGSVRIASNWSNDLPNVAFLTPDHKKVLIVLNDKSTQQSFVLKYKGKTSIINMNPRSVSTLVF